MTIAAVWRHGDRLFAVADTRIVRSPGNVLTEHGPKLLPIGISCKKPGPSGFFDREAYRTNIGFAYAGGTLPALSTHALANALLQKLVAADGAPPPDLAQVATAIRELAWYYMREVGELSGAAALFSTILFGFCAATGRFRAFELKPDVSSGSLKINIHEHDVGSDEALVVIGSRPDLLRERVAKMRIEAHPAIHDDLPRRALRNLIAEDADPTIGGSVQYGWATIVGFEPIASGEPIIPALPSGRNITSSVLGFDIMTFPPVRHYHFSMAGRVVV
jgi:hypothetical protein